MLFLGLFAAGCIAPPQRDQQRDAEMASSARLLQPDARGPVDAQRSKPGDVPPPPLAQDVPRLASDIRIERIQADNRLRQAGPAGIMAAAAFLAGSDAATPALIESMNFLMRSDLETLPAADSAEVRARLAELLGHPEGKVRASAARTLQVLGPGGQRTAFLRAIGDPEDRVRWAVVRHFGDFPQDADRAQLHILLGYLRAGTDAEFDRLDADGNGQIGRSEFVRGEEDFRRLDKDASQGITRQEWLYPVDTRVRLDVYQVLLRLHEKLTPDQRPIVYNPLAAAGEQQESIAAWQAWIDALPRNE